jgi:acetaldehyde dehydrogenase (acetylating)
MEDLDLRSIAEARRLLGRASDAAPHLASLDQESVDRIVHAIHQAAVSNAQSWARLAVDETGFGNLPDKIKKNLFAARDVYEFIRPMRTVGVLREHEDRRVIEIAAPAGVIAAIIPSTNPTSTAINKILIALKAACPIVISPHPNAKKCIGEVARVLAECAEGAGAPPGSIGCMAESSLAGTRELMTHAGSALILATGGSGLVKAAYSSGKPAYGVGPGNVPAYVDRTADILKAARDIITGKTFDNGVLCSSENAVVADSAISDKLRGALVAEGAYFLDAAQAARLSNLVVTPAGNLNTAIVGKAATVIAGMAGIDVPAGTRCLVAELDRVGPDTPLSREKLSPILAYYVEDGWEAGCSRALEILALGGMGHTMSIHARDRDLILKFGMAKPVFRIVVNSPAALGAVGVTTGVDPSMTLGCGALGGNITSDNITPLHLINTKRLAFETRTSSTDDASAEPASCPEGQPRPATARCANLVGSLASAAQSRLPATDSGRERGNAGALSLREKVESALQASKFLKSAMSEKRTAAGTCHKKSLPMTVPASPISRVTVTAPAPQTQAVPFVCEADVRKAVLEDRKIPIGKKTILTPAARDLGNANEIFITV